MIDRTANKISLLTIPNTRQSVEAHNFKAYEKSGGR